MGFTVRVDSVRMLLAGALLCGVATPAESQVDPSGAWRTWHSAHFRVHARAADSAVVAVVVREAERSWDLLSREVDPPHGTVDVVVANNLDLANGFAAVFPTDRITVYAVQPTGSPSLIRFDSWQRLVLTHELTHVFHIDRAEGLWGVLQGVFGRAPWTFPVMFQPRWVTEGIATYYESRFTAAGRLAGEYQRGLLAAAAFGRAWPRPEDATPLNPRWPAGGLPYAWGAEFFSLEGRRGDSVVPRFIRASGRQLWPFRVSAPMVNAGGTTVSDGWRELYGQWRTQTTRPDTSRLVIARGLRAEPGPRVHADGERLVYVHDDGRSVPFVRVLHLSNGTTVATHRVTARAEAAWVGDTVYLNQLEFTSPVEVRSDVYRWVPNGAWTRVSRDARLRHPFGTRAGTVGAVAVAPRGVCLRERRGTEWRPMRGPVADAAQRVVLSPTGTRFAGSLHHDGRWDIAVWSPSDPDHLMWVTDDAAMDLDPTFARDGNAVVFSSERGGLSQVYAFDLTTKVMTRLTDEPTGARSPAVVGDGTIVYVTPRYDGFAIVRAPYVPGPSLSTEARAAPHFDAAPATSVRTGGYDPWPSLTPRFWLPFGHLEGRSGTFVGAATASDDPIGRTAYAAFVGMAVEPLRFESTLLLRHSRWRRFAMDLRVAQAWNALHGGRFGERERRAEAGLTWRWRRWRTTAQVRVSGDLVRRAFFDDSAGGVAYGSTPTMAGAALRFAGGTALRPAFAISRESGFRVEGLVRRRWALHDTAWSAEVRGAVSGYVALPLPGFAHWVLATRVAGGRSVGPARPLFEIGGASGEPLELIPGTILGERRPFPLRGYPTLGLATRAAVGVVELRIPLLLVGRGVWKTPFMIDRVSAAVFGEIGGGWDRGTDASLPYRDVGAELVTDIGAMYDFPLRVRAGVGIPLTDGLGVQRGHAHVYVTAGSAF